MASILGGFIESVRTGPHRPALSIEQESWSYEELAEKSLLLSSLLERVSPPEQPLVGILAEGSLTAYTGILATLFCGRGYVPVHPDFPPPRILDVLDRSGVDTLIVGTEAIGHLDLLLERSPRPLTLILPDLSSLPLSLKGFQNHHFLTARDLPASPPALAPPDVEEDSLAYLLFTSGSTGLPKGVPITHRNCRTYLDHILQHYQIESGDRTSQTFKLAFDLSVHDIFTTLSAGACLHPLSKKARFAPGRFIREKALTHWFCVPTLGMTMARFRQLQPGAFPSLRVSLFCGEALPASLAEQWSQAAPNSRIDNLYGPTEATIAFTSYRWRGDSSLSECRRGIVPLGRPFPNQELRILSSDGTPAGPEEPGELFLSGAQVASGYWNDPGLTAERFLLLDRDDPRRWYRTGDRALLDPRGDLHFLGRTDHQIQIGGHRVELAEVDHALRRACGHDLAISVASHSKVDQVQTITAFIAGPDPIDEARLLRACRQSLPAYMVPTRVIALPELPCNTSGKIDRRALQELLPRDEV